MTIENTLIRTARYDGNLMKVNVNEAWKKLAARQFAEEPARAFVELLANAVDSYPDSVARDKLRIDLVFSQRSAVITDFGEGMSTARIECLLTLGGTDKSFDDKKIGQFGVGFCSIFNPELHTKEVIVTTRCEGRGVSIRFVVVNPEAPPRIDYRLLDTQPSFSTRVECVFGGSESVSACRRLIGSNIEYCPYDVRIDGKKVRNIWKPQPGVIHYRTDHSVGRVFRSTNHFPYLTVLCKYMPVTMSLLRAITVENSSLHFDWRDFRGFAWLPGYGADVNCDSLSLTVSRNSFYLDSDWRKAKQDLACAFKGIILRMLHEKTMPDDWCYANIWVWRSEIRKLADQVRNNSYVSDPASAECLLFEKSLFEIDGKPDSVSLKWMVENSTEGVPLFYCREEYGRTVLNGKYKKDFVVLLPASTPGEAPEGWFSDIADALFDCRVVDLDTLHRHPEIIKELVESGVIDGNSLVRKQKLDVRRSCDKEEKAMIGELNEWMSDPRLQAVLKRNLQFPVRAIEIGMFDAPRGDEDIIAALFDEKGELISSDPKKMFEAEPLKYVYIGLNARAPLVQHLKSASNPFRKYYWMGIIVHELVLTQKVIPFSDRFYYIRSSIERDMVTLFKELLRGGGRASLVNESSLL